MITTNDWRWFCNNKIFDNKLSAIVESTNTSNPIHFCEPTTYKTHTWHINPCDSWQNILKNRARYIRENSSYVRLWYSGGCDSQCVLDAFVDNNIFIDEIICSKSGIKSGDYEIDNVAIPYLKSIKNKISKSKITILEPSLKDYETAYSKNYLFEKFPYCSSFIFRLTDFHSSLEKNNSNSLATDVYGKEKPYVIYRNNQWWTYWLDLEVEPTNLTFQKRTNFFYDDPVIHTKQCHMLINYISKNTTKEYFNQIAGSGNFQNIWNTGSGRLHKNKTFINKQTSVSPIYFEDLEINVMNRKDSNAVYEMLKINPTLVRNWNSMANELSMLGNGKWFNGKRCEYGTVGVFSNFYSLTSTDIKTVDQLFPEGFTKE